MPVSASPRGASPPPQRAASRWQMNQRTRGLSGARQQRAAGAQGTHPSRGTAWRCPRLAQDGARCQSPGTCSRGRPSSPSREVGRADPAQLLCSTRSCGSPARPVHPMAPLHVSPQGTPKICRNTGSGQLVRATLQVGGLRTGEDRDWPHLPIAWKPGCRPRRASGAGEAGRRGGPAVPTAHRVFQLPLPWDAGSLGTWQSPRSWSWPAVWWPGGCAMNTE